ncbi:MAG: tRNA(5-methylaminomethyl-2-thiouridylate) methyltransferase [Desulfonatronovibrio sp.]
MHTYNFSGSTSMKTPPDKKYDALALFSGGLDSILAARLVQNQGLRVLGLHFISPFFGHPDKLEEWEHNYGIPLMSVDISSEFVHMLCKGPEHGLGKILNPCVDCKILMLNTARTLLCDFGAAFIISGEVLGQRPMSQRLDTLNIIKRDAGVKNILVRALSARRLPPTDPEKSGLLDREKLGSMSGRGRKEQIKLAREFNIHPIPTPAGGCLLTEKESAKRYLPLLTYKQKPEPADFLLANTGRQFWLGNHWLCIGRNKEDNDRLEELAEQSDYLFKLTFFPGPLALGRPVKNQDWSPEILESACELVSRFSPKARKSSREIDVIIRRGETIQEILVWPGETEQPTLWQEPVWDKELVKTFHAAAEDNPRARVKSNDSNS